MIASASHGHEPTAGAAALSLVETVVAVLMASFVADIIASFTLLMVLLAAAGVVVILLQLLAHS